MPADTRPTIDLGTRYGQSAREKAKAAADLRAGEARSNAESTARKYDRARKARASVGFRGKVESARRRKATSEGGTSVNIGPAGRQYDEVE